MRAVRLVVALAVLGALACSGKGKGNDGVVPPDTFSPVDFCAERRDTQCAIAEGCYPGEPDLKGTGNVPCYRNTDLHQDFVDCMNIAVPSLHGVAQKTMDWDQAGAEACIKTLKSTCPGERLAALRAACPVKKFLVGKALVGKPCYVGQNLYSTAIFSDCDASVGWCQMQINTCVSSCQSFALEGDPCGSSDCNSAFCRLPDLTCDGATQTTCGTCQPAKGTTCTAATDCAAGQACHAGKCEAPAAGEPCAITDMGSTFCAAPAVCVPSDQAPSTGVCGDRLNPGAPCKASWQCKAGLLCGFDDKGAGSCQEPLAENAPCTRPPAGSLTTADPCVSTARCQAGTDTKFTCVPMVPLGKDCRTKDDVNGELPCAEGYCRTAPANTNGICSALLGKGKGCTANDCDPTQGLSCRAGQCEPPGKEGDNCCDLTDCETGRCTTGTNMCLNTCLPACTG